MNLQSFAFLLFSVMTIGGAGLVVYHRNILYAAFSLMLCFFGLAGLYILLLADFVAAVQVLLYVGGVIILILFAIMLSQKMTGSALIEERIKKAPTTIGGLVILAYLLRFVFRTKWPLLIEPASPEATIATLGNLLLSDYVLPFEVASILLLAALIGAVTFVRQKNG